MTSQPSLLPPADAPVIATAAPAEIPLNELVAVNEDDYNADQSAVRSTWLKLLAEERSPSHVLACRAGLIEPTEAMLFGQFLHSFVLEPDLVGGRFYREPELGNRNSKVVKEQLAALAADHPGKIPVREAKYDHALKMRDALYAHRAARKLLEVDGYFERSIFWRNEDTSELCKARYDKCSPGAVAPFVVDLKTTVDASPRAFGKQSVNLGYPLQADHYTEGGNRALRFIFIAVEKTPPFGVAVYATGDDTLALGRKHRLPSLRIYAECRVKDEWPGYDGSIQRLILPPWTR